MVPDAFDDGVGPRIAHAEAFAGETVEEGLTSGRSVGFYRSTITSRFAWCVKIRKKNSRIMMTLPSR
jgi:hypothetical protein